MKLEILPTAQDVARRAAEIVLSQIRRKPDTVLGLPTGSTPELLYDELSASGADFSRVSTYNLDEYYPMSPEDPQSYRRFMEERLFRRINIDPSNTHLPDGLADDPETACRDYEAALRRVTVDLQVLGVGRNGHIGFNEPGTPFDSPTHIAYLTEDTIAANARFFESPSQVPTRAVTMGIGSILRAKKILFLATGAAKGPALRKLLDGTEDPDWPVTALLRHQDVTVLCDREAYD